jgi:hypothetical protein
MTGTLTGGSAGATCSSSSGGIVLASNFGVGKGISIGGAPAGDGFANQQCTIDNNTIVNTTGVYSGNGLEIICGTGTANYNSVTGGTVSLNTTSDLEFENDTVNFTYNIPAILGTAQLGVIQFIASGAGPQTATNLTIANPTVNLTTGVANTMNAVEAECNGTSGTVNCNNFTLSNPQISSDGYSTGRAIAFRSSAHSTLDNFSVSGGAIVGWNASSACYGFINPAFMSGTISGVNESGCTVLGVFPSTVTHVSL